MKKLSATVIIFSVLLSMICFPSLVSANEINTEIIYYFNDFSEGSAYLCDKTTNGLKVPQTDLGVKINSSGDDVISASLTTSQDANGTSVMRIASVSSGKLYNLAFPKVSPEGKPDIVVEYRVRASISGSYYIKECAYANWYSNYSASKTVALGGANFIKSIRMDGDKTTAIATFDTLDRWNTITIVYKGNEGTRDVYINGEYKESATNTSDSPYENYYYTNDTYAFLSTIYLGTNHYVEFDYMKIYKKPDEFKFSVINGENTEKDYIDIKFNSSVKELNENKIEVNGEPIRSIECISLAENLYRLNLYNSLDCDTQYSVTVSGVENVLGNSMDSHTENFKVRKAVSHIEDVGIYEDDTPLEGLYSGEFRIAADAANELDETDTVSIIGVSFDNEGSVLKNTGNVYKESVTINPVFSGKVFSENKIVIPADAEETRVFMWKSETEPVPVSGYSSYKTNSVTKEKISYKTPSYAGELKIDAEIKDDYTGMTITVETGDTVNNRMVGILVKYEDNTEYMITEKSVNGEVVVELPLKEENIGNYYVTAGVEKGGSVSTEAPLEYYSPSYINNLLENNINNKETATPQTVKTFMDSLGGYLKIDMEAVSKLSDPLKAYEYLLVLRDEPEGDINDRFNDASELKTALDTAIELANIYEGRDTASVIENSTALGVDEKVINTINEDMSPASKAYMTDKLKEKIYNPVSLISKDIKAYAVLGAVYGADNYKQVRSVIEDYGTELGINMVDYTALSNPKVVEDAVMNNEFGNLDLFKTAVNDLIYSAKTAEALNKLPPVSSGGGGGGGGGGSRIDFTPEKNEKEDKKEETSVKISYTDVKENDWFYNDVTWATEKGLFIGTDTGAFLPHMNLTWEHIAIVLKRMGFETENKYGNKDITRGELAKLLFELKANNNETANAYDWVKKVGLFIGDEKGDMLFDNLLTRAQCCTVLRRLDK